MDKELLEPDLEFLFEKIDIALMGNYENHYYEKYKDLKSINDINKDLYEQNQFDQIDEVFLVDINVLEKFKKELGLISLGVKGENLSDDEQDKKIEELRQKGKLKYQIPKEQFDNLFFIINNIIMAKSFDIYNKTGSNTNLSEIDRQFFGVALEIIEQFVRHITYYFELREENRSYKRIMRVLIGFILSYCGVIQSYDKYVDGTGLYFNDYIEALHDKIKDYVFIKLDKK